jgi:hypothetical protein
MLMDLQIHKLTPAAVVVAVMPLVQVMEVRVEPVHHSQMLVEGDTELLARQVQILDLMEFILLAAVEVEPSMEAVDSVVPVS